MGAMQAIKEAGLRIPQDVAVIGFDDRPEAMAQEPPLTIRGDEARIPPAFARARTENRPFILLVTRSPE